MGTVSDNQTRSSGLVKSGPGGVPSIAGDKSPASAGDVWYNSSSNVFKTYIPVSAWSSGGAMGAGAYGNYGCGTQSACLTVGGWNGGDLNKSETYNGSSWSAADTLNAARYAHSCSGTVTDSIACGGHPQHITSAETFNGTSWTTGTAIPAFRNDHGSLGTSSTAHTFMGGDDGSGGPVSGTSLETTVEWNGTSYSAGGDMDEARLYMHSVGTITNGLVMTSAGADGTGEATGIKYDGTSWSTGDEYPAAVRHGSSAGNATDAVYAGGQSYSVSPQALIDNTYSYDGSAYTAEPDHPTNKTYGGTNGYTADASAMLWCGGSTGPNSGITTTYEWDKGPGTVTISSS